MLKQKTFKVVLFVLLSIAIVFGIMCFAGCGEDNNNSNNNQQQQNQTETSSSNAKVRAVLANAVEVTKKAESEGDLPYQMNASNRIKECAVVYKEQSYNDIVYATQLYINEKLGLTNSFSEPDSGSIKYEIFALQLTDSSLVVFQRNTHNSKYSSKYTFLYDANKKVTNIKFEGVSSKIRYIYDVSTKNYQSNTITDDEVSNIMDQIYAKTGATTYNRVKLATNVEKLYTIVKDFKDGVNTDIQYNKTNSDKVGEYVNDTTTEYGIPSMIFNGCLHNVNLDKVVAIKKNEDIQGKARFLYDYQNDYHKILAEIQLESADGSFDYVLLEINNSTFDGYIGGVFDYSIKHYEKNADDSISLTLINRTLINHESVISLTDLDNVNEQELEDEQLAELNQLKQKSDAFKLVPVSLIED